MLCLGKCPQKPGLFLSWPLSQLGHPCLPDCHGQGCCFPLCWPKGHFAAPQPTCYLWVSPEYRFPFSHTISPTQSLFPWSLCQNPLTSALSIPLPTILCNSQCGPCFLSLTATLPFTSWYIMHHGCKAGRWGRGAGSEGSETFIW